MQKEVNFNLANIQPLLKHFEGDDDSLKKLLLRHSGVLYECRVCKNIFRSLVNLASHKRDYCKQHICESMLAFNHEIPGDLEPENPLEVPAVNENICPIKVKPKIKKKKKKKKLNKLIINLSKVVEATNLVSDTLEKPKLPYEISDNSSVEEMSVSSGDSKTNTEGTADLNSNQRDQFEYEANNESSESFKMEQRNQERMSEEDISCDPSIIEEEEGEATPNEENYKESNDESDAEHLELSKQIEMLPFIKEEIIRDEEIGNKEVPEPILEVARVQIGSDNSTNCNQTIKKCTTLSLSKGMLEKLFKPIEEPPNEPSANNSTQDVKQPKRIAILNPKYFAQLIKDNSLNLSNKTVLYKNNIPVINKKISKEIFSDKTVPKDSDNIKLEKEEVQTNGKPFIVVISKKAKGNSENISLQMNQEEHSSEDSISFKSDASESDSDEEEYITDSTNVSSQQEIINSQTFPCPFCDVVLGQSSSLARHLKTLHGKVPSEVKEIERSIKMEPIDSDTSEENELIIPEDELNFPDENELIIPDENIYPSNDSNEETLKDAHNNSNIESDKRLPVENNLSKTNLFAFNSSLNINSRPKRIINKKEDKDFVSSQTIKWNSTKAKSLTAALPPLPSVSQQENVPEIHNIEKQVLESIKMDSLECLKCHKRFNTFSNLRRHVALHIGWNRFGCKMCKFRSYNKSDCKAHVHRIHKDIEDAESIIVELEYTGQTKRKLKCMDQEMNTKSFKLTKISEILDVSDN